VLTLFVVPVLYRQFMKGRAPGTMGLVEPVAIGG
jgi:hypothetical protein